MFELAFCIIRYGLERTIYLLYMAVFSHHRSTIAGFALALWAHHIILWHLKFFLTVDLLHLVRKNRLIKKALSFTCVFYARVKQNKGVRQCFVFSHVCILFYPFLLLCWCFIFVDIYFHANACMMLHIDLHMKYLADSLLETVILLYGFSEDSMKPLKCRI